MREETVDYENSSQRDKKAVLEHAVLTKSPEEISMLYRQLGQVENSARALALACRFRGLEYVKVLVEGGAKFAYKHLEDESGYFIEYKYWLAPLEMNGTLRTAFFLNHTDACFTNAVTTGDRRIDVLHMEQRVEIVKYLYENREKVCLDAGELLYYAIMSGSKRITRVLKEFGVKFTEHRIKEITENGLSYEWQEFCSMLGHLGDEEVFEVVDTIVREIGGKSLYYTDSVYWGNYSTYQKQFRFYKPEFFRLILEHFNQKKMNKTKLMKGVINQNSVACLEICAEKGWLAMPKKRDEMIRYASENDKPECSAWLLDFKNRTADFAAEREKAEKKMMRELNANPNSVTELKKIWGYEKCEDGTIVITRYKGSRTEVEVPEKIGSNIVTQIGSWAFSPRALRLRIEQSELRREITQITLPKTICVVGESAFEDCQALVQVNIPDSVVEIGARAFWGCNCLRAIELHEGVTKLGEAAFGGCAQLGAIELPEGITEIGNDTFQGCQSLKSVTIPKTVEVIRRYAFYGCTALETVVISEGVIEIRQQAFANCISLKAVVLPCSVQKIRNDTCKGQTPKTIFDNDTKIIVTVTPKSYAEKYCRRNNIAMVN